MRLKRRGSGYIDRDTGKPVPESVARPIIYNYTVAGFKGYMKSPSFRLTEKNKLPASLVTIAERQGGDKKDYDNARHRIAVWLTDRKYAKQTGDVEPPFPTP